MLEEIFRFVKAERTRNRLQFYRGVSMAIVFLMALIIASFVIYLTSSRKGVSKNLKSARGSGPKSEKIRAKIDDK